MAAVVCVVVESAAVVPIEVGTATVVRIEVGTATIVRVVVKAATIVPIEVGAATVVCVLDVGGECRSRLDRRARDQRYRAARHEDGCEGDEGQLLDEHWVLRKNA